MSRSRTTLRDGAISPTAALSVVIPSHSTRDLTVHCLTSVAAAAPPGSQIVLVDDASEDDTVATVRRRFPAVELVCFPRSRGFSVAANEGIARTSAPVVLLLNSDTVLSAEGVAALLRTMALEPSYGILGAQLVYPDGSPQWSGGKAPTLIWLFLLASGLAARLGRSSFYQRLRSRWKTDDRKRRDPRPRRVDWVSGAAMAFRRQAWDAAGPMDERFRFYSQDLDFCLRASAAGWGVAVLPAFSVVHHHGATIGRRSMAVARQDPTLLWTDLVRWARKHRGRTWGRWAALALLAGARLRLAARAVRYLSTAGEERRRWQRERSVYRQAMSAVREQVARQVDSKDRAAPESGARP